MTMVRISTKAGPGDIYEFVNAVYDGEDLLRAPDGELRFFHSSEI